MATGRQARDQALAQLTGRYDRLRGGLAEKGVAARMSDAAKSKAKAAAQEAVEIADSNKGVIAATGAALALWLFRKPLSDAMHDLWPRLKAWADKEQSE